MRREEHWEWQDRAYPNKVSGRSASAAGQRHCLGRPGHQSPCDRHPVVPGTVAFETHRMACGGFRSGTHRLRLDVQPDRPEVFRPDPGIPAGKEITPGLPAVARVDPGHLHDLSRNQPEVHSGGSDGVLRFLLLRIGAGAHRCGGTVLRALDRCGILKARRQVKAGFEIRDARPEDAPFLAKCIMAGMHFYDFETEIPSAADIYERLVVCERRDDLLYSYRYTRVAEADGILAGSLLSYPGAIYRELRHRTFCELWPELARMDAESEPRHRQGAAAGRDPGRGAPGVPENRAGGGQWHAPPDPALCVDRLQAGGPPARVRCGFPADDLRYRTLIKTCLRVRPLAPGAGFRHPPADSGFMKNLPHFGEFMERNGQKMR